MPKSGIITYGVNKANVEMFLGKYPKIKSSMMPFASLNIPITAAYKKWLRSYDDSQLGGRAEVVKSESFGTKTFYKFDWDGVGGWAEVFQYLYYPNKYDDGGGVGKEKIYIEFLNKKKNFQRDRKYFTTQEQAIAWGRKNLGNFNIDMLRYEYADGGMNYGGGGVVIGLVNPDNDKIIKTQTLDTNYRESEERVRLLNEKLNKRSNPKGLFWKVVSIGYSNGGEFHYQSKTLIKSLENKVLDSLIENKISVERLTNIIKKQPDYPYQYVGAIKLQKVFLQPFYQLA